MWKEKLNEWIQEEYKDAIKVSNIFTDYFGEELVDSQVQEHINDLYESFEDMKDCDLSDEMCLLSMRERFIREIKTDFFIIIRFPKVRVTNENDKYVDITELYVRVGINRFGKLSQFFQMIRGEYTAIQWISDYAHSHLPGISIDWMDPCLGSGPIYNTQCYLRNNAFDADRWELFCFELSKYVTVESLTGRPYRYLESIGRGIKCGINIDKYIISRYRIYWQKRVISKINAFIYYYIKNASIHIGYANNQYVLGYPVFAYWVDISRCFINWVNSMNFTIVPDVSFERLKRDGIIQRYIISDNEIYTPSSARRMADTAIANSGTELFTFKGKTVKLIITNFKEDEINDVYLLDENLVASILSKILEIINCYYGREEEKTNKTDKR